MDNVDHQFSSDVKARMRFITTPNVLLHRHEWRYWCSEAKAFAREYQKLQSELAEAESVIDELLDGYNHQRDCDIENIGKPEHLHVSSTKLQRALTRAREYQGKKEV